MVARKFKILSKRTMRGSALVTVSDAEDFLRYFFRFLQKIDYVIVRTPDPFPQNFISRTG